MPTQHIAHSEYTVADRKPPVTNSKNSPHPAIDTPQQYHGDLRKGAYLQRRAAYRMQAETSPRQQAGTLTAQDKGCA